MPGQPCAGVEVRLYKQSPQPAKAEFTQKACELGKGLMAYLKTERTFMFMEFPGMGTQVSLNKENMAAFICSHVFYI